jgi:hypothetical protein
VAVLAYLACAASFGLWVSVRASTVQRASGLWLLSVGLWVGGTFLAAQAAYMEERAMVRLSTKWPPDKPAPLVWDRALNPALAWSELIFRVRDPHETRYREYTDGEVGRIADVLPALLGVALYGLLAWAFYAAAARRFEREGRG